MMQRYILIALLVSFLGIPLAYAQHDMLAIDLAEDHVDITTGFNGARLTLFGVHERPGYIAIVITGPKHDMIVRRKEKTGPLWMNRPGVKFKDIPTFYDYALNITEEELASPELLKEHGIGVGSLKLETGKKKDRKDLKQFQAALIRNKQTEGLFPAQPQKIKFLNDHFFRTSFYLPPNVKTGQYEIKTYLFDDKVLQEVKTTQLKVAQVGVSAGIYNFAHNWSFAYGALCVLLAVSVGWFSSTIRRHQ